MRIRVIAGRCTGHARCAAVAPELYILDDDGFIAIAEIEVSPAQEQIARRGARACPERAIDIVGE